MLFLIVYLLFLFSICQVENTTSTGKCVLTIIIPVKRSAFLIDVLEQSLELDSQIQIIFVVQANDNSLNICRAYQRKYRNKILILKKLDVSVLLGEYTVFLQDQGRWDLHPYKRASYYIQHCPSHYDCLIPNRAVNTILLASSEKSPNRYSLDVPNEICGTLFQTHRIPELLSHSITIHDLDCQSISALLDSPCTIVNMNKTSARVPR